MLRAVACAAGRAAAQPLTNPLLEVSVDSGLDHTLGGCFCRSSWSVSDQTCMDGAASYTGCGMPTPCDGEDNDGRKRSTR